MLSTLKELFLANKHLFKTLDISNSEYQWPKHPIIYLSFTVNVTTAANLTKDLEWLLSEIAKDNNIDLGDAPSLQTKLKALIRRLALNGKKVVVLIDEYDYPIVNNISNPQLAVECRQVLRDFFVVFKEMGDYIRFLFIKGVTKFSKTSIFSGLNNLKDITYTKEAGHLLGYTHEELTINFEPHLRRCAQQLRISLEELLVRMRDWYNGYQFAGINEGEQSEGTLYNPFSIVLFLSQAQFHNFWAETGTPQFLNHLIASQNYPIANIDGSEVNYDETTTYEIDKIPLIPLLWQTGYLTIDRYNPETDNYKLRYPNKEVRDSFFNHFLSTLSQTNIAALKNFIREFDKALREKNLEEFFKILKTFYANIPYTIQLSYEKYYQTIFYIILRLIGSNIDVEITTNEGRIDAIIGTANTVYIFEFKLNKTADEALEQIEETHYAEKYSLSPKTILLIGVNFDTKQKNINEWKSKVYIHLLRGE